MLKPPLLALTALLVLPSVASAARVTADTEQRQGALFGPVSFYASAGERNALTITQADSQLRFHDDANPVIAQGDCDQVDVHTATCPVTENFAKVRLANRDDRATVEGRIFVFGGSGDDVLRGSRSADILHGQSDADRLIGKGGGDRLTAGPGSDIVLGGGGDDDLIDGETDTRAFADVFRGGRSRDTAGSDRGDLISYSLRERALEIRLSQGRRAPDGDVLSNLESIMGGSGNDRIVGDLDDNSLEGNGGKDRLDGRHGDDTVAGGSGDDDVRGGPGDDIVSGGAGHDRFNGQGDDDMFIANDSVAERIKCNLGFDTARVTRIDKLVDCEVASSDPLFIRVRPEISGDTATFLVACQQLNGCDGTLQLSGPGGQDFGRGTFNDLPDDPETFSPVTINLTDPAVEALAAGVIVQVAHGDTGGYRAFMQSG
jgi:Ca2+-binding RTX toxin-like protein